MRRDIYRGHGGVYGHTGSVGWFFERKYYEIGQEAASSAFFLSYGTFGLKRLGGGLG